jgi:hypothetical protein
MTQPLHFTTAAGKYYNVGPAIGYNKPKHFVSKQNVEAIIFFDSVQYF